MVSIYRSWTKVTRTSNTASRPRRTRGRKSWLCPGDQAGGKIELPAPSGFGSGHPAAIGFMIQAGQMQNTVQHQDADLVQARMAELARLDGGAVGGDGELAKIPAPTSAGKESTSVA